MTSNVPQKRNNLASGKDLVASGTACNKDEEPRNVIDGSSETKWCSKSSNGGTLDIDLKEEKTVRRIRIAHAGVGATFGDKKDLNTKDFEICCQFILGPR